MLFRSLTSGRLAPRADLAEPGWRFWERRTLNLHRVVALWSARGRALDPATFGGEARAVVRRHFRRAWWRGLGFAVVVACDAVRLGPDETKGLIDGRENAQGTWQWLVQVAPAQRAVVGAHTWIEGYLSPLYRELLDALAPGNEVVSLRKERDGLMRLLTAARPHLFPEFRDAA